MYYENLHKRFKNLEPVTEDFEDIDFVTYKYYDKEAVLKQDELSERALELTQIVIEELPSCFSAYFHRRKCFDKLGLDDKDIIHEIEFMDSLLPSNPKCFQIWKYFVEKNKDFNTEIKSIDSTLDYDNKNYHAWAYRVWLCKKFNLFEQEKKAIELFIDEDLGNNSAWSYRFFLYKGDKDELDFTDEDIKSHIAYVEEKLKLMPENQAAWNYLHGFFDLFDIEGVGSTSKPGTRKLKDFPKILKICEEILENNPENKNALATKTYYSLSVGDQDSLILACKLMDSLKDIDSIRSNYWQWLHQMTKTKLNN